MRRGLTQRNDYRKIACTLGISEGQVASVVESYFGSILSDARKLPFNNARKIYDKKAFESYAPVVNIPHIGRIGPVYSRYLTWRANEAKHIEQRPREHYRSGFTRGEIETIASEILAGRIPSLKKKRGNEMYNRVWLVGQDGKKLARQVIPKNDEDV